MRSRQSPRKAIDGDGAPSRRCEAGRDGSAYGGRGRHGEAEVTAAAAGAEVRGRATCERNPSGYRGNGTMGRSAKRS